MAGVSRRLFSDSEEEPFYPLSQKHLDQAPNSQKHSAVGPLSQKHLDLGGESQALPAYDSENETDDNADIDVGFEAYGQGTPPNNVQATPDTSAHNQPPKKRAKMNLLTLKGLCDPVTFQKSLETKLTHIYEGFSQNPGFFPDIEIIGGRFPKFFTAKFSTLSGGNLFYMREGGTVADIGSNKTTLILTEKCLARIVGNSSTIESYILAVEKSNQLKAAGHQYVIPENPQEVILREKYTTDDGKVGCIKLAAFNYEVNNFNNHYVTVRFEEYGKKRVKGVVGELKRGVSFRGEQFLQFVNVVLPFVSACEDLYKEMLKTLQKKFDIKTGYGNPSETNWKINYMKRSGIEKF